MSLSSVDTPPRTRPGILVVEEEVEIRQFLALGLGQHGFTVWTAANGTEALNLFRRHGEAVHLALLDVQMSEMDGPMTLRALRAVRPDLPCCFMTGGSADYSTRDLLDLGAVRVFPKPFHLKDVAELVSELTGWLERREKPRFPFARTRVTLGEQEAWVRDRSASGLGLWSPQPVAVGSLLFLQLDDESGTTLPGLLEIRYCQPDADGWLVGCRFTKQAAAEEPRA